MEDPNQQNQGQGQGQTDQTGQGLEEEGQFSGETY